MSALCPHEACSGMTMSVRNLIRLRHAESVKPFHKIISLNTAIASPIAIMTITPTKSTVTLPA